MANDVTILVRAKDEASKVFSGIQGAAGSMAKGVALAAGGGALALAGIGIAATKMAADFESSLAEVQTLLPNLDEQGFGKLRQGVLDFSKEMGVATDQAVPALYQAISAGVPPDNVLDFMRIASKAATGGVTSLETAVDGITSVVNAYGDEVIDAQKAADIMFTAVKLGKTDFEQLSKSLFNVIPTAAAMGVSFEEVAASLALMTAQGVPTSVATTQLRAAFLELSKTGSVLDKSVQELLGGSFADLQKQGWDIGGVFAALKDRSDKAGLSFSTLFSSSEAMSAALVLAQNAGDSFGVALEAMGESAGAVDAAFSTVSETANFKLQKAMNTVKVMMIEFGSIILPHVATFLTTVVVPALDRFGDWFTEHKPQIEQAIQAIIDVSLTMWQSFKSGWEVVGPLLQRFATWLYENKPALIAAIAAVGLAIVFALGPVSGAALAIVGLITLIGFLRDHWTEVTAFLERHADKIAFALGGPLLFAIVHFRDEIAGAFIAIKNAVAGAYNFIAEKVAQIRALVASIPSPGDIAGGIGGFLGGLPGFAEGGLVPGPMGAPRLAVVHGGERVLTPGQQHGGRGGGDTYVFNFHAPIGDRAAAAAFVQRALKDAQAEGFR